MVTERVMVRELPMSGMINGKLWVTVVVAMPLLKVVETLAADKAGLSETPSAKAAS